MHVAEMSVRRPITGIMIFLSLTILGFYSYTQLKLDMFPTMAFPVVAVITTYDGAGPESIEQLVTRPVEEAMSSVENVVEVTSQSRQGVSMVMVSFSWGTDMHLAEQQVRKNLEVYTHDRLPTGVKTPLSFAFDPSMQPVMFLSVRSPGTPQAVRKLADKNIAPYLTRVPGVAAADIMGGIKREIHVKVRPEWLQAYHIPVEQVVGALRMANALVPAGTADEGNLEYNIVTHAEFSSVSQVGNVVVGQRRGVPVYLRDVADVVDGFEDQSHRVLADGVSAVMMAVRKQSDANTVQVTRRLTKALANIDERLPGGTKVVPIFNEGEPITLAISNLASTAVLALLFTAAVLLAFLRSWRGSSIALVSIPLSILGTFSVMQASNVTLNIISMAGLALAIGMLVDNAIVVLENIHSKLDKGVDPKTAAIEGTKEMAMPITASTLTTIAVFAPVLFVPGLAGELFQDMSLTICFSLTASLIITLTLVPLMASLMLGRHKPGRVERLIARVTWWLDPLSDIYARSLKVFLRHKWKVILVSFGIFASSLVLGKLFLGADFLANNDRGQIMLDAKAAPGSSMDATGRMIAEAEKIIHRDVPEAVTVVSDWGAGEEFAAILGENSYTGTIRIRLKPLSERKRSQAQITQVLRKDLAKIPGIEITPRDLSPAALTGKAPIEVQLFGDDLARIRRYGEKVKAAMENVDGAKDVRFSMASGRPELQVDLDRNQIKLLGLTPAGVAATIHTYFMGTIATMYRDKSDEYKVLVRAPKSVRQSVEALRNLPVVTPTGLTVPLATVAHVTEALGPTEIDRDNQQRLGKVTMSQGPVPLATLVARVKAALKKVGPAPGITTVIGGTAQDMQDSFVALGIALLVAILLVYMVMASQFESLLEPFVILFAVPMAVSGVIFALLLWQTTLQVTALIGMILLAGVVVNNGIVLIDVLKQRRYEGMDLVEAALEAGRSRLRPILMTTLTTVLGMLPLALGIGNGAKLWAPMARAVIGGLTLSTLLTLVFVPTFYVLIAGFADRRKAKKAARRAAEDAEAEPARSAA